jgi:trk system potassium uptake protein
MTRLAPVANVLGGVLMIFALTYVLPIATALIYDDGTALHFLFGMVVSFGTGSVLWVWTRASAAELRPRDGYLLVTFGWLLMSAMASIPLLTVLPGISFTDAYFEALSGLTTTGSTVLTGLDSLPPAVNLWRHALQWFGGMGIIVLAIAILPLLGVGGMQLYRAEMPGAVKDTKLTPRITDTAKSMWMVYAGLTLAAVLALRAAGMDWFDAVNHAFSALALGGFSTHDASIGYFDSPLIEGVLIFFMLVATMNFATHFAALRGRSLGAYLRDPEAKAILAIVAGSCLVVALYLWLEGVYPSYATALRHVSFNLISIALDCGYASVDYNGWPVFATFFMLFLSCMTCSTGSTGSGIKMYRTSMLVQQAGREFKRLIHPQVIVPLRFGTQVVPNNIVYAVLAFIFVYFMIIVGLTFVLLVSGMDALTAFSSAVAWTNNVGPGLGEVGPASNYAGLTDFQKWVGVFAMLAGRLELFTVLVLLTPAFWRK